MANPLKTLHPLPLLIKNSLLNLPAPINISIWWNFGSILGLCLCIQLITGIFLAIHYLPRAEHAFASVVHITRDINNGWLLRSIHANGASFFFFAIYIHIGRGIYYNSFNFSLTWYRGVLIFILTIATAFLGYVLPWGQISFWAATVITNFFSAIPLWGKDLVEWVWGGFAVTRVTLTRFFTFHFILPFILIVFVLLHLLFLHETGSREPLGLNSNISKIPFHPYYTIKDLLGFSLILLLLSIIILWFPYIFTEPENFIPANPLSTPLHIKPEWYFLWAYTILRSIPNKLGGVTAIFAAVLILATLPSTVPPSRRSSAFYPPTQILFWTFSANCLLLTWIGGKPVEPPYEALGQCFTSLYFLFFFIYSIPSLLWDWFIDT